MSNEIIQKALSSKGSNPKADHYRTYLGKKEDKKEEKPVEESALEK
jgi:hypothetical protein